MSRKFLLLFFFWCLFSQIILSQTKSYVLKQGGTIVGFASINDQSYKKQFIIKKFLDIITNIYYLFFY